MNPTIEVAFSQEQSFPLPAFAGTGPAGFGPQASGFGFRSESPEVRGLKLPLLRGEGWGEVKNPLPFSPLPTLPVITATRVAFQLLGDSLQYRFGV